MGFINKEPVCFVAINKFPHPTNKNIFKVGRVVTMPHWQGYGIGMRMVEDVVSKYYQDNDVRFTTTLPIIHEYLWKRKSLWGLKFQGVRRSSDAGKNASMSVNPRECYLETYQFKNDMYVEGRVSRTRCPIEKVRQ